ncbi:MAG: hypothetical protein MUC96_18165 [Myxococcaceae bacterium]|jgi:hypothetical protein|nr:hypothetical protein [Myxococcaceae bacterium]
MNFRVLFLFLLTGCATTVPRFSQPLATSFARDQMRRLETKELEVYYPAEHREAAERVARRASECLATFRGKLETPKERRRAVLFLTSANFNNAYVTGLLAGEPLHSVNPLQTSLELFNWYGLSSADAADVSCHEMLHVVHFEQVDGFWGVVNLVAGDVVSSQLFLERWFTEGAAQYYEGRVGRPVGRPHSPLYRGAFESFVASRGAALGPGDLSTNQRELFPFSGAYLTSLPFVEWLIERNGEAALWQLIGKQGTAFFAPLGVSLRFSDVYGANLGDLVAQWARTLARTVPKRERPATQTVLRPALGQLARLAVHAPTGRMAIVQSGNDEVPMLRILGRDGTVLLEDRLARVLPGRPVVQVGPEAMSGLSFSADGRFLFLMNEDLISTQDTRTQLWKLDVETGALVQLWPELTRGQGGALMPDQTRYLFVETPPGRTRLATVELATGAVTPLYEPAPGVSVGAPQPSPDGRRIAFSQLDGNGWNLRLREADGTVRALTDDGAFNYGAKWEDDEHLVFARTHEGRLQAFRLTLATGTLERLTDAPWAMLDVWPTREGLVFINRDGTQWSLDRAPLSPALVADGAKPGAAPPVVEAAPDGGAIDPALTMENTPESASGAAGPPVLEPQAAPVVEPKSPPPFPDAPPLVVTSDEPYSGLDRLFVPQLRLPAITVLPTITTPGGPVSWVTTLYASLSGRDRLGWHNWAINGTLALPQQRWSLSLEYRNLQLAPFELGAFASREAVADGAFYTAALSVSRSFWTVPVALGFRGLVSDSWTQEVNGFFLRPVGVNTFTEVYVGPELSASWAGGDSTAYGGSQRLIALSGRAAAYPAAFGSDRNVFDLRGALSLGVPLPLSQRQSFVVSLVGRGLPGSPEGALRVGGQPQGLSLYQSQTSIDVPRGPGGYLPGTLAEAVRGYDDFTLRTNGVGIGSARYRYSFIIDRGTASILWLFPSFFARQIDVEAFGSGALTLQGEWLRAAGGAVSFRFNVMDVLPFTLTYQYAWRFDFGRGGLHTVSFSLE